MGAKINLTSINSKKNERYIKLTRGNTDISQYFENWIGIDDTKQSTKDSEELLKISNNIALPENHGTIKNRDDLQKHIFDFANLHNNNINLNELSQSICEDSEYIPKYCSENNIDIDHEFKLINKNSFYKIKAKGDGIEISGVKSIFNSDSNIVEFDLEKNKTIITSENLIYDIQQQLNTNE